MSRTQSTRMTSFEGHPGEAGLDHLRKQVHGSSLDTVKLNSEISVLDKTSTALHRAASHGDTDVLKMILDPSPLDMESKYKKGRRGERILPKPPPREDIGKRDTHGRTALHVAAYQGKFDALAYLASKASKQDMEARDEPTAEYHDGRTALQILAEYDGVVEKHRSVVCDELLEDIEVESQLHRLAATHYSARHFAFFYWPALFLTMLVALCAYSMGDEEASANYKRRMSIFVGFLATLAAALNIGMNQVKYLAYAAQHESAEHDLSDLVTELKFQNLTGFVDVDKDRGEINSIDVALLHKRFEQIIQGTTAPFPAPLVNLYSSLKSRLEHEMLRHRVRPHSEDFRLLRDMAYQRAQVMVTSGFGWPYLLPWSVKGTVKRVVKTVLKRHKACRENEPAKEKKAKGEILVLKSNHDLCLDIKGASMKEKARAILFKRNGGANQRWRLNSLSQLVPQHTLDLESTLCLDIAEGQLEPDNEVQLYTAGKSSAMHQRWKLDESGYLTSFMEGKHNVLGIAQIKGSGGNVKPVSGSEICLVKKGTSRSLKFEWLPVDARGKAAFHKMRKISETSSTTRSPLPDTALDDFDFDENDPDLHRFIDGDDEL